MSTLRNRLAHLWTRMVVAFVLTAAWLGWTDRLAAQQAGKQKASAGPKFIIPPADLALMKALDSKVKFSVKRKPMKEVLNLLEEETKGALTFVIDSPGFKEDRLADEGIFLDYPVTQDFKRPMKVRAILKMILGTVFDYYIEDGALYITLAAKANKRLVVRNYPVSNLVGGNHLVTAAMDELQTARVSSTGEILFGPDGQLLNQKIDSLKSLIKGSIEPGHWKTAEGSRGQGTITFVPATASLQINCSLEVHYLLMASGLLDNSRAAMEPSKEEPRTVTVRVYNIAGLLDPNNLDRSRAELQKALNQVGNRDDSGQRSVVTYFSTLTYSEVLVVQPLEVHRRIERLLANMHGLALAASLDRPIPAEEHKVPEKYRATVDKGLEYLAKSQFADGHWEGDGGMHPVAITALAGIALLTEGSTINDGKYSANIRKAADWLMDKSQARRDGLIFSGHTSETSRYMQGHGLATFFLAGTWLREPSFSGSSRPKKFEDALTRAVKYIVNAQSTQGGWYHTSRVEGHDFDTISATVLQIQALQAIRGSEIVVPSATIQDAREYLKTALAKYEEKAKSGQNRLSPAEIAAALGSHLIYNAGSGLDDMSVKWIKYCWTEIPVGRAIQFGRDEAAHYYYAPIMYHLSRDTWIAYRTAMFDHLQSSQNKDGSWPTGSGGLGPVYAAAVWCTILQLDNKFHPLTQYNRIH